IWHFQKGPALKVRFTWETNSFRIGKVRVELNRAVGAVYGPTFGSWGAAPGSFMRQHRSALNKYPVCGRLLLVIACAVLFRRRDYEEATPPPRSRQRDSLRLRRFIWARLRSQWQPGGTNLVALKAIHNVQLLARTPS